jgi:hypothetical protein
MTDAEKWTKFQSKYAAFWGRKLADNPGAGEFAEFVTNSKWEYLEEALKQIAEEKPENNALNAPTLPTVQRFYYMIKKASEPQAISGKCLFCDRSGWVTVLFYREGQRKIYINPEKPEAVDPRIMIYETDVPCSCSNGEAVQEKLFEPAECWPMDWRRYFARIRVTQKNKDAIIKKCRELYTNTRAKVGA